jgi:hypothetical protein
VSWEPASRGRDPQRLVAAAVAALLVAGAAVALVRWGIDHRVADGAAPTAGASAGALRTAAPPVAVDPDTFAPTRLRSVDVDRGRSGRLRLAGAGGRTLIVIEAGGARLVDLATGGHHVLRLADAGLGTPTGAVAVTARGTAIGVGRDVVRIDPAARPVRLAVDHRLVSAGGPTALWLHAVDDATGGGTATLLDDSGTVLARLGVPPGTRPIAGTAERLVVGGPGTLAVVRTDGSRRVIARGDPVASDGERVAWVDCADERACAVVMGTVDDPARIRTTAAPADLRVIGPPTGAFSPDGRWLALPRPPTAADGVAWHVVVLDTATGVEVARVDGTDAAHVPMAWSPDGRWLVIETRDGLTAWQAGRDTGRLGGAPLRIRGLAMR